jgi:hypothetical protein
MTNIDVNVERELADAELETVAGGSPTLQGILAAADKGAQKGSSWGQSHFGDAGGVVGGVVGAVVGAIGALFD